MNPLPFVSVIVPVRNGAQDICKLIETLLVQDYPKSHTEIIIVDNGSQDQTKEMIKNYPVVLEIEDRTIGSYAARNKGIRIARGDILAFTDGDCLPERNWLSEGVRYLNERNADIGGGRIQFNLPEQLTAAEIVDSVIFLQNNEYVSDHRGAVTANLFVRSRLFKQIGLFPVMRSGGDIEWTGQALKSGFSLIYLPQAIVHHPLRKLKALIGKNWRVGTGIGVGTGMSEKNKLARKLLLMLRLSIPVPAKNIRKLLMDKDIGRRRASVWLISYFCQLTMLMGISSSLFYSRFKK